MDISESRLHARPLPCSSHVLFHNSAARQALLFLLQKRSRGQGKGTSLGNQVCLLPGASPCRTDFMAVFTDL